MTTKKTPSRVSPEDSLSPTQAAVLAEARRLRSHGWPDFTSAALFGKHRTALALVRRGLLRAAYVTGEEPRFTLVSPGDAR